eukprot:CAMPEP_0182426922 /NCGR_PEP_ID=MMETSP1167-20130531/13442_1 /TAXON_ID=2988 /ORGANISM="Mallomonas Sp, Strain CCMP3275" /LENGTH=330 /DNA_ID=CAMNT_0024608695 /DNA_START=45 /DNA_END=1034 /DNA_ORIENTATION=-
MDKTATGSSDNDNTVPLTIPTKISPRPSAPHLFHEEDDGIDLSKLFATRGISVMVETKLPYSVADVWRFAWHLEEGYRAFLQAEGDFDIVATEWTRFNGTVSEDKCKLPFSFSRTLTYLHPRTTMLMFGPKNAPTQQTQYLYLAEPLVKAINDNVDANNTSVVQSMYGFFPQKYVVLTMTVLDGIPMSDTFKICQYWSFASTGSGIEVSAGHVRIGCDVHFVKPTMFKNQISTGTESELQVMSKKWCGFMRHMVGEKLTHERQVGIDDSKHHGSISSSGHGMISAVGLDGETGLDASPVPGIDVPLDFESQSERVSSSNASWLSIMLNVW